MCEGLGRLLKLTSPIWIETHKISAQQSIDEAVTINNTELGIFYRD